MLRGATWLLGPVAVAGACSLTSSLDDLKSSVRDGGGNSGDASNDGSGGSVFVDASCFNSCDLPHAAKTNCENNSCIIVSCDSGYDDCDGVRENGCEADLGSKQTCGACDKACPSNPDISCSAGACVVTCPGGTGNCNGDSSDGCETVLDWDGTRCGDCSLACAAGTACSMGHCVSSACSQDQGTMTLVPTSDMGTGLWAASPAPPFYAQVDETPPDGVTTYIWDDSATPSRAVFGHASITIPSGRAIAALAVTAYAELAPSATVPTHLWLELRMPDGDYDGPTQEWSALGFLPLSTTWSTNPKTNLKWSEADLESLGFGIVHQKPITTTNPVHVTEVLLEVCLGAP